MLSKSEIPFSLFCNEIQTSLGKTRRTVSVNKALENKMFIKI